jgi:hypothetical protein
VRVVPDRDGLRQTCRAHGLPVQLEERAAVAAARAGDRGHAGQRADAGAAGETEEDGLGLVVAGVGEEDRGGAVALRDGVERRVPRVARGGLGSAVPADGDRDRLDGAELHRREAGDDFGGTDVGPGLEAVVDGDAAGPDTELGRFEGEGGGEAHRIGSAGAGDQNEGAVGSEGAEAAGRAGRPGVGGRARADTGGEGTRGGLGERRMRCVVGEDVVENAADRQAYRRDRRMGTHVRCPS